MAKMGSQWEPSNNGADTPRLTRQLRCDSDPAWTLQLCKALPKAELHAHINGCIRRATLAELCAASADPALRALATGDGDGGGGLLSADAAAANRHLTLSECFELFGVIHGAVGTVESAARVAAEVVEDFAADNVRYCELRTTPRPTIDRHGDFAKHTALLQ